MSIAYGASQVSLTAQGLPATRLYMQDCPEARDAGAIAQARRDNQQGRLSHGNERWLRRQHAALLLFLKRCPL